ncbi:probable disease resistance protein At1g59620 [Raphanus sativus]|uniref:Probable disease resistance protein At1g59620 n=1 Tax=Raphanus sativus TaxID=3726 RepID=A0A9W3CGE7_RAPSA|nr:probable disease resistance protein At1g59620 [Raphanus sativus]
MAELAVALLPFAVERLWNILVRETERFQGVGEQFDGLKSDVETLRCFLEDAEAKKHTSAMVRKTIKDVKEIVLDAEDIIETFLLKKELGESSSSRNSVRRLAYATVKRVGLAFDMKTIRTRISKVIRDMQNLGVQKVIVNEESTQSLQRKQRERRQTFSSVNEKDPLVGFEKNVEKIVGYLVEDNSSQVVSITGMGGLGKTTLARQVFNHETIKTHFPGLAWVCVSQQFERDYVWQTILEQLRPEIKVFGMTDNVLKEKLVGVLETQKALVVIDDIWREEDWDLIEPAFLLPGKGWKILLTTRNEGVALHADRHCVTFKPECLNFEDSWDLFQMIAFPMEDTAEFKVDEKMEEMGKQMIKCCGGLPLAVKVLGGMLAAQYALHEWERIYENIKALIVRGTGKDDSKTVYDVLYLSYEELPAYLKHCFLYLAHFPEDYQIDMEDLSYYWAAEGMPRPRHCKGASIRDVGDGYIEELVKRNMVISERDVDTSRFETCQLHDMMREVCLHKAEEDNFVQIIQGTSTANHESPGKFRRLAVHRPDESFNVETSEVTNASLRTLLFIDGEEWKATSLFFKRHKLMRVLDLSRVKFEGGEVPSSIGKLIHLRYLSLKDANVTHLPSSMRNLKQLLYLNIDVSGSDEVYIPSIFKEMQELIYLYLPERLHAKVKLELGNLVKLETLKNFSTEHGSVSDLQGMTKLRTLSMYIEGQGCSMKTLSSSLSKITHLENLTINNRKYHALANDEEEGFVLDSVHLRQLKLETYMPRLPDPQHFPSHLTKIHLTQCRLEKDPMPILEKLEHLKEVNLEHRSFSGKRMVCSRGGFPQLKELIFYGLKEWEEWIVEEGSMPLLRTLYIGNCGKLKEIPHGLRFITSLENLSVSLRGEECKMILSEQYLHSRLTSITLSDCRFEEDPMPILEKLLYLKRIDLSNISFGGNRMVCSRGGFPQLEAIWFYELKEFEEWIVEEGSMPLLRTLVIRDCKKWKELPDGLRFITSLDYLRVSSMGEEWKKRLSEGGEDYYKVQHIPSVEFEFD